MSSWSASAVRAAGIPPLGGVPLLGRLRTRARSERNDPPELARLRRRRTRFRLSIPTVTSAAQLTVRRLPNRKADLWRAYKVHIDGEPVGKLRRREAQTYDVPPGAHAVHLTIDWARSPTVEVELAAGDHVELICRPNANAFLWPYWLTAGRHRYITLEGT